MSASALLLNLSSRLYSVATRVYPVALRVRYESDMQEVFRAQIHDAWLENGLPGLARVWFEVAVEIFAIALPCCLRVSGIGLIAGLSSLLLFYSFSLDVLPFYSSVSCSAEAHKQRHLSSTDWTRSRQQHHSKAEIQDRPTWHASDPS